MARGVIILLRTLKVHVVGALVFEEEAVILNRIRSNNANRRRQIVGCIVFQIRIRNCSEGEAAGVAGDGVIPPLPDSIGSCSVH